MDTNNDGILNRDEFERVEWRRLARLFAEPGASASPIAIPASGDRLLDDVVSIDELAVMVGAARGPLSLEARSLFTAD